MERDYLDFDIAIETTPTGQVARVTGSPAGTGSAPFVLPFGAVELAQFMNAVGPPRVASRRLVPVEARGSSHVTGVNATVSRPIPHSRCRLRPVPFVGGV